MFVTGAETELLKSSSVVPDGIVMLFGAIVSLLIESGAVMADGVSRKVPFEANNWPGPLTTPAEISNVPPVSTNRAPVPSAIVPVLVKAAVPVRASAKVVPVTVIVPLLFELPGRRGHRHSLRVVHRDCSLVVEDAGDPSRSVEPGQ